MTVKKPAAGMAALTIAVVGLIAGVAPTAASAKSKSKPSTAHYYLALGDSLSVGYQPTSTGAGAETSQGYTNQLLAYYGKQIKRLKLVEVGCPGDTTSSLLTGQGNTAAAAQFNCDRKGGSQLAAAVAFLKAHHNKGEVPLVSIDIGANDVDGCTTQTTVALVEGCVGAGVTTIEQNTPKILAALKKAAPKGTTFAAMNLYDPVLAYALQPTSPDYSLAGLSVSPRAVDQPEDRGRRQRRRVQDRRRGGRVRHLRHDRSGALRRTDGRPGRGADLHPDLDVRGPARRAEHPRKRRRLRDDRHRI